MPPACAPVDVSAMTVGPFGGWGFCRDGAERIGVKREEGHMTCSLELRVLSATENRLNPSNTGEYN